MAMNGAAPQTTTFAVTGADTIEDFLASTYSGMRLHCDTDHPWFRHRRTDAGAFTLNMLAADPATTTVSAVAARYGFANHSRFTATYHATYGVLPSSTLHGH